MVSFTKHPDSLSVSCITSKIVFLYVDGVSYEKDLDILCSSYYEIFVCPSSTETFGNVVLEAMASGLPVIGADAGGVGELISHQVTGLKFQQRSIKELTNCMRELIEDFDTRDYLKENGKEFAANRSWEKVFMGLMDIYDEVLDKNKKNTISA